MEKDNPKYQIFAHPDGTHELIVNYPHPNDSGKFVCKAYNRAGESSILHPMLFEGKEAHIVNNRHRVFHADQQRLQRAKIDARGGIPLPQEERPPEPPAPRHGSSGTPAGLPRSGTGTRTESSPAPAAAPVESYAPAGRQKEEKRESKVGIHFASKLSDRVVVDGSKVKLTCYLDGTEPVIKWFKDEQQLAYSPKCKQSNLNGVLTLEFPAATEADSGVYKCVAKNNSGEVTTTCNLQVFPSPGSSDAKPTFTRSLKDSYHTVLNEINLSCHVRGNPTPTVTWVKDGVTCEASEKYQIKYQKDGTCELNISYPSQRDMGKYVCQAENRAGNCEITHQVQIKLKEAPGSPRSAPPPLPPTAPVEVEESTADNNLPPDGRRRPTEQVNVYERRHVPGPPPDPKANLHFAAFLSDRTVAVGSKVKLTCYLEGPEPVCRWFKEEPEKEQPTQLVNSSNCKFQYRDGLVTLELKEASLADSGVYKVMCRNTAGEISSQARLTVYQVPTEKTVQTKPLFTSSIKGKSDVVYFFCLSWFLAFCMSSPFSGMCIPLFNK